MATSYTPTNPIGTDGASGDRTLGIKLYSNEVLTYFARKNMFLDMVKTRTINGGISSQFIVTGQASDTDAASHTPGADVAATVLKANERVITITDRVYYSHFVDKLEEKISQYEIRDELAKQAAEALATKIDKAVAKEIVKAVTAGAVDAAVPVLTAGVAGQKTGSIITATGYTAATTTEAKGDKIVEALFEANADMNGKDVPEDGRTFITTPLNYAQIVQSQKAVNRDFTNGNGGIDTGNVLNIAGTPIKWSNHLPIGDATLDPNSKLLGLFFQSGCVGVVKAMDITSESNYLPEKLGDLLTSYYALGMGLLEPARASVIIAD